MCECTQFVKPWLCPSHLFHSEFEIFKMSLFVTHDDFAILLMYITSLYTIFCICFVLPFLGHHLRAVLLFISLDKVASFVFLAGTISSGVYMCVCVFSSQRTPYPASHICLALSLYILPSCCWELVLFLVAVFSPLLLFLLAIMAKYRQAAKPLIIIINSEDPSKKDRKCLRSANGTGSSPRIQIF